MDRIPAKTFWKLKHKENPKTNKYGNRQTSSADGHHFSSKFECAVYQYLRFLEKADEIKILKFQDNILMTDADILYIPDFKIFDNHLNEEVWVEAKGFPTPVWQMKKRIWRWYGAGLLRIYYPNRDNDVGRMEEIRIRTKKVAPPGY